MSDGHAIFLRKHNSNHVGFRLRRLKVGFRQLASSKAGLKRRQTQLTLMRASAADVFRAHGVTIDSGTESRSKHWAHLIAHCLIDPQEAIPEDPVQEIINLVPSTAEANYNTLEAIELFIRRKLLNKETDRIHIYVKPNYSGESLIPDNVVYTLNWTETKTQRPCEEVFHISPQSHQRLTKSMHQSINLLRNTRKTDLPSKEMQDDENEGQDVMRFKP
jgi:hypothetical protein